MDDRPTRRAGEPEAIFIVGVSRSGTTLARRILDRHSRVGIATENHFLGHLLPWEGTRHYLRRLGDPRDDAVVRAMVELIYSGELLPEWKNNFLIAGLSSKALVRLVLQGDRVVGEERLLTHLDERIREVVQTPAGAVLLLTDGDDAKLLELTPRPQKEKS